MKHFVSVSLVFSFVFLSFAQGATAEDPSVREVNAGNLSLWNAQLKEDGNRVWFLAVTSKSLRFIGKAASGTALDELGRSLPFAVSSEEEFDNLLRHLGNEEFHIKDVSAFWLAKDVGVYRHFLKKVQKEGNMSMFAIPEKNPEVFANRWVQEASDGKLAQVFRPEMFERVNAMLTTISKIKGEWVSPFSPDDTIADAKFYPSEGEEAIEVPMLSKQTGVPNVRFANGIAAGLKVKGGALCVLLLPDKETSVTELSKSLSPELLEQVQQRLLSDQASRGGLEVPKFDISARTDLVQASKELGMKRMFTSSPGDLSFKGMTPEDLYISQWFQQANLRFDEYGFEGEAVEVLSFRSRGIVQTVKCNRPFLMLVLNEQGMLVTVARIDNPKE